jgi:hypothetical protein
MTTRTEAAVKLAEAYCNWMAPCGANEEWQILMDALSKYKSARTSPDPVGEAERAVVDKLERAVIETSLAEHIECFSNKLKPDVYWSKANKAQWEACAALRRARQPEPLEAIRARLQLVMNTLGMSSRAEEELNAIATMLDTAIADSAKGDK